MSLATANTAHAPAPHIARAPGSALLWLAVCSTLFFTGYGFANWAAAQRVEVGSIRYAWEQGIPFLPWSIVPYWSIDLFYALAFFLCADAAELQRHVRRILTAQLVAVICFLAFPLQLAVAKPASDGFFGFLFSALGSFDRPYNQAPSLHIALLVILWALYARHLPRRFHLVLHAWSVLIGVSVLTTFQHHFIDLPTGAVLGLLCLWLWPEAGALRPRLTRDRKRRRIAALYALGAAALSAPAPVLGGWWLWLLWPALSLLLVALNYLALGAAGFEKHSDGTMPLAVRLLLLPYLMAARLNAWIWTRSDRCSEVGDGVWIGRLPAAPHPGRHAMIPALDLIPLSASERDGAAATIEAARARGPVLVACALGYGRSAAAVAAWLVANGRAGSAEAAATRLHAIRPRIVLDPESFR